MTYLKWLLLGWFILSAGCSNPITAPSYIQLFPSTKYSDKYPFTLRGTFKQNIRFNHARLSFQHLVVDTVYQIYVDKDTGTLHTGEFSGGELGVLTPLQSRGTITLGNDYATVDIEVALQNGRQRQLHWEPYALNGTYRLVRLAKADGSRVNVGIMPIK